jgi:hypothetical protein
MLLAMVLLLVVQPAATAAQQAILFSASATGSLQEGDLHLSLYFDTNHASTNLWSQVPDGFDLYRRAVGTDCGEFERISEAPVAWTWDPSVDLVKTVDYTDTTTADATVYEYMIRAVDSQRLPIPEDADVSLGYVTRGEALIGHGTLTMGTAWCVLPPGSLHPIYEITCLHECFPPLGNVDGDGILEAYADGQTVRLYGQIYMTHNACEVGHFALGTVTGVEPYDCLVGVESMSWSDSKRLYR